MISDCLELDSVSFMENVQTLLIYSIKAKKALFTSGAIVAIKFKRKRCDCKTFFPSLPPILKEQRMRYTFKRYQNVKTKKKK